jgi:hypothetical protein
VDDVYVKYTGQKKQLTVQFPVPFVAKSEAEGDPVEFKKGKPVKLPYRQAEQLLKVAGNIFEKVDLEVKK